MYKTIYITSADSSVLEFSLKAKYHRNGKENYLGIKITGFQQKQQSIFLE